MTLLQPLPGKVGNARVFVVELGVNGIRILHQGVLPRVGQTFAVDFNWEATPIHLECEVIHNDLQKLAKSANEKSTYSAGCHVISAAGESAKIIRKIISDHIERALDEQKANAQGIPAKAAHAFQTGKAKEYIRCQLVQNQWRKSTTTRPDQPENGFTVSADEDPAQIEMLCESYATGDPATRQMIRMMAEASVTPDGVPTRKYTP